MKRFLFIFISLILVFANLNTVYSASWCCKRTKDHSQPPLSDDLKFVSPYSLYWKDENHSEICSDEKVIYLTFDAGYENGNVEKILNLLNEENVQGAFFILENLILKNEDLVKKMIDSGHIVANHTSTHKDVSKISQEEMICEIKNLEELYKSTYGKEMPKYFRPPEGKFNEENLRWLSENGYKTVMWSFAYADWDNRNQPSNEYAYKKIIENVHNGEVMLLHPNSKTNADILQRVIKDLKAQGFRFGTLDELCK